MKKLILICAVLFTIITQAQEERTNCKKELEKLASSIKVNESTLYKELDEFDKIVSKISINAFNTDLVNLLEEKKLFINNLKDTLSTSISKAKSLKESCILIKAITKKETENLLKEDILEKLSSKLKEIDKTDPKETETQVYSYFGKDQVIKNDFIDKSTVQGRVLNSVLSNINEESYFGDITIPKENQVFSFINSDYKELTEEKYKFKKLEVEIRDGSFADIRVTVSYKGNLHTFENYVGVSLMYFSSIAKKQKLFYAQSIISNQNYKSKDFNDKYIRLSDVMDYKYSMGNHYIPHDLTIELPKKDVNDQKTNATSSASYEIKQETYLDKIVEFRTYTDFLSLFGEGNNGLVSVEANAKFYIFPYPRQIFDWKSQWEFLPSIIPQLTYNKFEESNNVVSIPTSNFTNYLDLIEKRYLAMGANLNVFQFKHKNFPITATLFGAVNYQLTQVNINSTSDNAKAFGYGVGINLGAKRFNNFGFNLQGELAWYDYKNSNTLSELDIRVPVIKAQAEVFYHPTKSPNQAIFMRLATYNYMGTSNDQAFYQFQFGYKFSIGSRTITKK